MKGVEYYVKKENFVGTLCGFRGFGSKLRGRAGGGDCAADNS